MPDNTFRELGNDAGRTASGAQPDVKTEVREPRLYAVVLHNDDFTAMDFVVALLMRVFQKTPQDAAELMMCVHTKGEGVAGVYPYDIAVSKKLLAERMAEERNYPLRITVTEA